MRSASTMAVALVGRIFRILRVLVFGRRLHAGVGVGVGVAIAAVGIVVRLSLGLGLGLGGCRVRLLLA